MDTVIVLTMVAIQAGVATVNPSESLFEINPKLLCESLLSYPKSFAIGPDPLSKLSALVCRKGIVPKESNHIWNSVGPRRRSVLLPVGDRVCVHSNGPCYILLPQAQVKTPLLYVIANSNERLRICPRMWLFGSKGDMAEWQRNGVSVEI
jgi:hypothetical protein